MQPPAPGPFTTQAGNLRPRSPSARARHPRGLFSSPPPDTQRPVDTKTAYAELGLRPGAPEREVRAAWRRLVSQWHPDRNRSSAAVAQMQRINRAFEHLREAGFPSASTVSAHANTDTDTDDSPAEARSADPEPESESGAEPPHPHPATEAERPAAGPSRKPIQRKLNLTLEEATLGCVKTLRGKLTQPCQDCEGAGYQILRGHCTHCGGSGAINHAGWFGWGARAIECEACHGSGQARRTCPSCNGSKSVTHPYEVKVRIPPGVRSGDRLHVNATSAGRAPADLELRVTVADHALFRLDDDGSLHCTLPVNGFAWMAGRSVPVPTPDGPQTLALQRGQTHYRLAGHGFTLQRGQARRGELLIDVQPVFPERLDETQQRLLDALLATPLLNARGKPDARLADWQRKLDAWQRDHSR